MPLMAQARVFWPSVTLKDQQVIREKSRHLLRATKKNQTYTEICPFKLKVGENGHAVEEKRKRNCPQTGLMRIIIVTLPSEDVRPSPSLGPAGSWVGRLGDQLAVSGVPNLCSVSKLGAQRQQGHQSHGQLQQPPSTLTVRHIHSQVYNSSARYNKSLLN